MGALVQRHARSRPGLWGLMDNLEQFIGSGALSDDVGQTAWLPAVDLSEDAEAIHLRVDLPGLDRNDVKISINNGTLTVQGERKFEKEGGGENNYYRIERSYGVFARSFSLPSTVEAEKVKATMKNGVLDITVPKREEAKAREVQIDVH